MPVRLALIIGLLLLGLPVPMAAAAEVSLSSTIDAVTVFPRGAEVRRSAEIALEAGAHVVVFPDLPAGVARDSVRLAGEASGRLAIGSVDVRRVKVLEAEEGALDQAARKALEDRIEALRDERARLDAVIRSAETQRTLLENLARLPTRPSGPGRDGVALTAEGWAKVLDMIGARMPDIGKRVLDARIAQRGLDRQIADLRKQLEQKPPRRELRTEVRVHLDASTPVKGRLVVTYHVANASWAPVYEARLRTGDKAAAPSLVLVRRARINQRTGEDWRNVALTLSTARPLEGTSAPDIGTQTVTFRKPPPPPGPRTAFKRRMAPAMEAARPAPLAAPEPIAERGATVRNAPFQALYRIPGRQSVPTVKEAKTVRIDTITLTPVLKVRTVPRRVPKAYLYAAFSLKGDVALLPGRVALFRDGVFVGRGRLPVLAAGEEHDLGFGIDDRVRVKFTTVKRERGKSGILTSSRTDERRFRITIVNRHARAILLELRDRIPVSEEQEIEVATLELTPAPSKRDVDGKRGVLGWALTLEPGAKQEVRIGYRLTWPKDKEIRLHPPGP